MASKIETKYFKEIIRLALEIADAKTEGFDLIEITGDTVRATGQEVRSSVEIQLQPGREFGEMAGKYRIDTLKAVLLVIQAEYFEVTAGEGYVEIISRCEKQDATYKLHRLQAPALKKIPEESYYEVGVMNLSTKGRSFDKILATAVNTVENEEMINPKLESVYIELFGTERVAISATDGKTMTISHVQNIPMKQYYLEHDRSKLTFQLRMSKKQAKQVVKIHGLIYHMTFGVWTTLHRGDKTGMLQIRAETGNKIYTTIWYRFAWDQGESKENYLMQAFPVMDEVPVIGNIDGFHGDFAKALRRMLPVAKSDKTDYAPVLVKITGKEVKITPIESQDNYTGYDIAKANGHEVNEDVEFAVDASRVLRAINGFGQQLGHNLAIASGRMGAKRIILYVPRDFYVMIMGVNHA